MGGWASRFNLLFIHALFVYYKQTKRAWHVCVWCEFMCSMKAKLQLEWAWNHLWQFGDWQVIHMITSCLCPSDDTTVLRLCATETKLENWGIVCIMYCVVNLPNLVSHSSATKDPALWHRSHTHTHTHSNLTVKRAISSEESPWTGLPHFKTCTVLKYVNKTLSAFWP